MQFKVAKKVVYSYITFASLINKVSKIKTQPF